MLDNELNINRADDQEVTKQIELVELTLSKFSARSLGEAITEAMGKLDGDPEKVAQSLVSQRIFENSADCPDPLGIARKVVARYKQFGERLREEDRPL